MESIKTATRFHFLDDKLPASTPAWFLSHPVQYEDGTRPSHYVITEVQPLGVFLYPVDVLGNLMGGAVAEAPGALTHEAGLQALGYTLTAPLVPSKPKTKRIPARTHLNTADIDRETGKSLGRKPACGQLNGTRTDRAQTHYTTDTAKVTCQRCITTKLFAKAMAEPDFTPYDAIDRKAWAGALENNKEFLEEFEKRTVAMADTSSFKGFNTPDQTLTGGVEDAMDEFDKQLFESAFGKGSWEKRGQGTGNAELDRVHAEVRAELDQVRLVQYSVEGGYKPLGEFPYLQMLELTAQQDKEIALMGESFDYSVFAGASGPLSGPGSSEGGAQ